MSVTFVSLFCLLIFFTLSSPHTHAQKKQDSSAKGKQEKKKKRKTKLLDAKTFKQLEKAQELIDASSFTEAEALLLKLANRKRNNSPFIKANAYNMLAFVAFEQQDTPKAIEYYEKVIVKPEEISEALEQSTIFTLGQLYYVQEDYKKSIESIKTWFSLVPPQPPRPHIFLAQVYYQSKQFDAAINEINIAMDKARAKNAFIKEQWWLLLQAMYYEKEETDEVIRILRILARDFPKKLYWVQLSGLYSQKEDDKKQTRSLDVAYIDGILNKERELLSLAGLLMQQEFPYRAGKILSTGMDTGIIPQSADNLEFLAQAWQLAQEFEKSIISLEKAARISKKSKLYLRLMQSYYYSDKYNKCLDVAQLGLRAFAEEKKATKGTKKSQKHKKITPLIEFDLLEISGQCAFNLERLTEAKKTFTNLHNKIESYIKKKRNRSKKVSNTELRRNSRIAGWIKYIESEIVRVEYSRSL